MKLISINELFRETLRIYRGKFLTLVGISAVPAILFLVAEFSGPAAIIFAVAGIAFSIASSVAIVLALAGDREIIAAYRDSAPYLLTYLWLSILSGLIIFGGFVLFLAPGFIFSIWFIFGVYVLVLENKTGIRALFLSKEYVKGYWWHILGRLVALFAVVLIPSLFLAMGAPVSSFVNAFIGIFFGPFMAAYLYLLYKNLKQMKSAASETAMPDSTRNLFLFSAALGIVAIAALIIIFLR